MPEDLNLYEFSRIYPLPLNSETDYSYDQYNNKLEINYELFGDLIEELKLIQFERDKANPFEIKQSGDKIFIQIYNYVGFVYTNKFTIKIFPKLFRNKELSLDNKERITELLIAGSKNNPLGLDYSFKFEFSYKHTLGEQFIKYFLITTAEVFGTSINKSYNKVKKYTPYIKGRILTNRLISNNRICCEFDELNLDNNYNRLIKSALRVLLLLSKSNENIAKIKLYLSYLNLVPDFDLSRLPLIPHMNSGKRLKELVCVSNYVLKDHGAKNVAGNRAITSMLYPMEMVFENYLKNYFKKISNDLGFSLSNKMFHMASKLDGKDIGRIKPDFQLEFDRSFLIADAKWKIIDCVEDIKDSDLYQMYAYGNKWMSGQNKNVSLLLIYPTIDSTACASETLKLDDELSLNITTFDLLDILDAEKDKVKFRSILEQN